MNTLAVIWDLDGTMVDTSELHFQAWQQLAAGRNFSFTRADFEATFGRRNPDIIGELLGSHLSDGEITQIGDEKEALYRETVKNGIDLLPGVADLLEQLHQAGFRQAVGSSAPRANVDLILKLTDTARYFSAIVSMEDCTKGKPDPQVFSIAANRLDVAPRNCLVIEDAAAGVKAAKAGGMKCIAVTIAGHHSPEKLREAGAVLVVEHLSEVSAEKVKSLFA